MSGGFGTQDALVLLLALAAVAWLVRRSLARRRRGQCTCDGCPVAERGANADVATSPTSGRESSLVTIEGCAPAGGGLGGDQGIAKMQSLHRGSPR